MSESFGLSKDELDALLRKGIDAHIKINDKEVRDAIIGAILENNQKIHQQIKEILNPK